MVLRNSFLLILLSYICKRASGQTLCTTTSSLLADVYEYAPNGTNVLDTGFVGILGTEITLSLGPPLSDYFVLNRKVLQVADGVNITRNDGSNSQIMGTVTCGVVGGINLPRDVTISIQTINLNPPKFQETSYSKNINEASAAANLDVLEVVATDDEVLASNINYTIANQTSGDYFRIRSSSNGLISTGVITTNKALPYQVDPFDLTITATSMGVDNVGSPWIQSSNVSVKIGVIDEDNHFPQFQPCAGDGACAVIYTSALDTGVTKVLSIMPENITALDLDPGINASIEYSLAAGFPDDYSAYFLIDSSTGAVSVITPFSAREVYTMTVEAKESSGKSSYASLRVDVNYVDNYKPNISISSTSGYLQESSTNSLAYVTIDEDGKIPLTISATDEDDDTATFSYVFDPNSFQVTGDGRVLYSPGSISTFATPTSLMVTAINLNADVSSTNRQSSLTISIDSVPIRTTSQPETTEASTEPITDSTTIVTTTVTTPAATSDSTDTTTDTIIDTTASTETDSSIANTVTVPDTSTTNANNTDSTAPNYESTTEATISEITVASESTVGNIVSDTSVVNSPYNSTINTEATTAPNFPDTSSTVSTTIATTSDSNIETTIPNNNTETSTSVSNTETTISNSNTETSTSVSNTETTISNSNTEISTFVSNTEKTTSNSNTETSTSNSNTASTIGSFSTTDASASTDITSTSNKGGVVTNTTSSNAIIDTTTSPTDSLETTDTTTTTSDETATSARGVVIQPEVVEATVLYAVAGGLGGALLICLIIIAYLIYKRKRTPKDASPAESPKSSPCSSHHVNLAYDVNETADHADDSDDAESNHAEEGTDITTGEESESNALQEHDSGTEINDFEEGGAEAEKENPENKEVEPENEGGEPKSEDGEPENEDAIIAVVPPPPPIVEVVQIEETSGITSFQVNDVPQGAAVLAAAGLAAVVVNDGPNTAIADISEDTHDYDYCYKRGQVHTDKILKNGDFGQARLVTIQNYGVQKQNVKAVVKALDPKSAPYFDVSSFHAQVRLYKIACVQEHDNILQYYGMHEDPNELHLAMMYAPNGDLKNYLKSGKDNGTLDSHDMMLILSGIGQGLQYLHAKGIIHCHLQCKSILLDVELNPLIHSYENNEVSSIKNGDDRKRWQAIEVLNGSLSSKESDVWSFGVLMWEVAAYGATPYADLDEDSLKKYLGDGNRLHRPTSCSVSLFTIVESCWNAESRLRPDTYVLNANISEKLIEDSNELICLGLTGGQAAQNIGLNDVTISIPDGGPIASLYPELEAKDEETTSF